MTSQSSMPLPLSVVIIAKNAERHLPRCLTSVADIAKEIILVHNDCTDRTVEIAQGFNAKTIDQSWLGYREQKNFALEKATQPWVLSLDADEELSLDLKQSIIQFVTVDQADFAGAYFARITWFMGRWIKHGTWYPDHNLRLIRRGLGRWIGGAIHEKLEVDGAIKKLSGDLMHYPYRDMKDQIIKMVGYSDLYLEQQKDAGKRWSAWGTMLRSIWFFFRSYILKLGFLDGYPGLYIAWGGTFSTLLKHSRLYEKHHHTEFPKENG